MDGLEIRNSCFNAEDSDVKLIFETEEGSSLTIPAHSFVLRRTSRVFKTMLDNKQFVENRTGEIRVLISGHVNVGLFFVKYLYTKTIPKLEIDMYIILLLMGRMYEVTSLAQMCEEKLWLEVDPFSVCRVYQTLESVASEDFLGRCLNVMKQSAFLIFMHNRHLTLFERTMKKLLEADSLTVIDEEQIVEAVWQWGLVRCIQENKPGNINPFGAMIGLLPYVRWANIPCLDASNPWSLLVQQQKKKCPNCRPRGRTDVVVALNKFAKELNFDLSGMQMKMSFRRPGTYQLLLFTTSTNIILSGLVFVIGVRVPSTVKDFIPDFWGDLEILVNKVEISKNASSKVRSKAYYQLNEQKFCNIDSYRIEVELLNPIVMDKSRIHVIDMCIKEKRSVAFPQFGLNPHVFPLSPSDQNGVINVHGKVSSLTSVFYFVTL